MRDIKSCATKELIKELEKRDGVYRTTVEPHKDEKIEVNGPAVVLVVID